MVALHVPRDSSRRPVSERLARAWRRGEVALWAIPIAAAGVGRISTGRLDRASLALVGIGVVLWASRRPDRALTALVLILPWNQFILAFLFGHGAPGGIVRALGFWQEALVVSVAVAALRRHRTMGRRLDRLDLAAMAFVAIGLLYYALPGFFVQAGALIPSGYVRELGWREDVQFVLLFVAARRAGIGREWVRRITPLLLATGAAVAAVGLYEFVFTSSWNHLVIHTFKVVAYKQQVIHQRVINATDVESHSFAGSRSIIRIGSVLLNPLALGAWLLVPLAIGFERMARDRARAATVIAVGLIGSALILTQTRSAIIGGLVLALLATRPARGRLPATRIRFALLSAGLLVLAIPLVIGAGLNDRTTSAIGGTDTSANGHVHSFFVGIDALGAAPLGHGLGTGPVIGDRFDIRGKITSENYYLQVGDELGVVALVVFVLYTVFALQKLHAAHRYGPGDPLVSAMWGAAAALALGCFLLHVWADYPVALTFWSVAGAALGSAETPPPSGEADAPDAARPGLSVRLEPAP